MRRKIVLLAAWMVLVACGMVNAQHAVGGEVSLLNPPDSLVYGSSYTFDLAMHNSTGLVLDGFTQGIEVSMDAPDAFTLDVGSDKFFSTLGPYFDELRANIFDLPGGGFGDTIRYAGWRLFMPGLPDGAMVQPMSFTVTFDDASSGATQFCIDTCWLPPGGEWLWAMSDGSSRRPAADWAGTCWSLCQPICGDVNGDLVVNISDMTYMVSYLFGGGPNPVAQQAADVNCDGVVNVSDMTYLINYLFDDGPAPCADCP
jgi:hypothetical protein